MKEDQLREHVIRIWGTNVAAVSKSAKRIMSRTAGFVRGIAGPDFPVAVGLGNGRVWWYMEIWLPTPNPKG